MSHDIAAGLARESRSGPPVSAEGEVVRNLARFFPGAAPVRIPVTVTCEGGVAEKTLVEFGTSEAVLFASRLPLEFGDMLQVATADASLEAEVTVVALHFENGYTAAAARFTHRVPNWIVKS